MYLWLDKFNLEMQRIILLFILLSSSSLFAQQFHQQKIENYITNLERTNQGMGSLAISQNGRTVYTHSFGYSNVLLRDKGNKETLYRIGDLSMIFTRVILQDLIDSHHLSLNSPLSTYFSESNLDSISIADLLLVSPHKTDSTHQNKAVLTGVTLPLSTDTIAKKYATYYRLNYRILSHLIETVTQRPFASVLHKNITSRFNLNRTTLSNTINSNNSEALSYHYKNGTWHQVDSKPINPLLGASAIISTPKELAHFFATLFSTPHGQQQLILHRLPQVEEATFRDKTVYRAKSQIDGFRTLVVYFPNEQTCLALCTNGNRLPLDKISFDILSLYYGY